MNRLVGLFLEPSPSGRVALPRALSLPPSPSGPRVAALGSSRDHLVVARAVAAQLAQAGSGSGSGCAVCATWCPGPDDVGPPADAEGGAVAEGLVVATGSTRALARRLRAQGHVARAAGRVVEVALPGDRLAVARAWQRLEAIVDVPCVLGLAGARPATLDAAIAEADLVVAVVARDAAPGLEAALRIEREPRVPVVVARPPARAVARAVGRRLPSVTLGGEVLAAVRRLS